MLLVFSLDSAVTGRCLVDRTLPWSLSLGVTGYYSRLGCPRPISSSALVVSSCCGGSLPQGVVNIHEDLRCVLSRNPMPREPWILNTMVSAVSLHCDAGHGAAFLIHTLKLKILDQKQKPHPP